MRELFFVGELIFGSRFRIGDVEMGEQIGTADEFGAFLADFFAPGTRIQKLIKRLVSRLLAQSRIIG